MRLEGKRVLVTGASRGIGQATAILAAREGADVAVNYVRDSEGAAATAAAITAAGRKAVVVQGDVSDRDSVEAFVTSAWDGLGGLDVLVNNAGIETIIDFVDLTDEQWSNVTNTNLRGPWMCSQVFVRRLLAEGRTGSIVNLGSIQAGLAFPGRTHYAPSKRGVEGLTAVMASELGKYGIRVNCVHPGVIETDMTARLKTDLVELEAIRQKVPLGRTGLPEEVAPIIVMFASDESSYITGQHIYVDGGMIV
ncbi:MAG: 3-oxoacyl-ACP reductase FabG [Propionibacteriaceae bacterium]|jgi:glucose 1-dehydrogenase/3-oxoacyl-[acyl-carrier protein] reductase|nr:3-oxoacyl-ACP reductase FabG [Propionibacteriaceae bacterium]